MTKGQEPKLYRTFIPQKRKIKDEILMSVAKYVSTRVDRILFFTERKDLCGNREFELHIFYHIRAYFNRFRSSDNVRVNFYFILLFVQNSND